MSLSLDPTQLDRYSRHIIMDEVGPEGQQALLDASVLVVGAGGLGAPVIQYLSAAGVGELGIADDDEVELSNLQRQIIHGNDDVGRPKVESAAEFVADLNPDVDVRTHHVRVEPDNAEELIADYDFVVDASDNFRTRYLVNDACTLSGTPFSHGAIYKFEGQVTTFTTEGPCYRCLFPEAPPQGMVPDCASTGVLGVLPGTVGCIQATETVKYLLCEDGGLDSAELLDGRMIFYDAMEMSFEEVEFKPNPDCPVCGENPIDSVAQVEYTEEACPVSAD
ncbi:SAMP-activating enzyme E1 [Halorussus lipolyticus]|uniref:SAMP-activating enzyme E1 n=1 Tax=Halorussus lipolyticus TaxID=3034024 RepID=UPI0023E7CD29|nr:molybdopterin-synthase adenylyltransferase MoeB [Halorussus sp. DT80]